MKLGMVHYTSTTYHKMPWLYNNIVGILETFSGTQYMDQP